MGNLRPSSLCLVLLLLAVGTSAAQAQWHPDGSIVTGAAGDQTAQRIVTDDAGGAFVTWMDGREFFFTQVYTQRIAANGVVQWAADGVAASATGGRHRDLDLDSDGVGNVYITWYDTDLAWPGVYVQKIDATGAAQWGAEGRAHRRLAGYPRIICDGTDGVYLSWYERNPDPELIYWKTAVQGINSNGLNTYFPQVFVRGNQTPRPVSDGAGGVVVGSESYVDEDSGSRIYGHRVSADGDLVWTRPVSPGVGCSSKSEVASGGDGGGIWTWAHDTGVFAQRMDGAGDPQWGVDGINPFPLAIGPNSPQVISDGSGGAIIVVRAGDAGSDIHMNRVLANGALAWTTSAVVICDRIETQQAPQLAPDGHGGAYVVWQDNRAAATNSNDIYAQHVDADGNPLWAADGVPVCATTADQTAPQITSTGRHSAIVTWQDDRNGDVDLYAQAMHDDGSFGDPPFGVLLTHPQPNAIHVPRYITIQATFNDDIDPATASSSNLLVHGSLTGRHSSARPVHAKVMQINPDEDFAYGEVVTVILTAGIESTGGAPMTPLIWSFTIEAEGYDGGFLTAANYPVGVEPIALCPLDFNGDGDMDLVVANSVDATVTVRESRGNGLWERPVTLDVGTSPHAVIAADLDRDGSLDVVTANFDGDDISVLINDGTGRFAKQTRYETGIGPESICAGDFDEDGYLDLATANMTSDDISVLINDGAGKFRPDVTYAAGNGTYFVSSGDLNDDGHTDLVATNASSDDITILLNDGAGGFAPRVNIPAGNNPNTVFPADLDQDGDLDLVVGLGVDDGLAVMLNNGHATFATPVVYSAGNGPFAGQPVDVDGDGDLDLIACTRLADDIRVRLNNGAGVFGSETVFALGPFSDAPYAIVAADYNGDGALDLVTANRGSDGISILLNNLALSGTDDGNVPAVTALRGNTPNPFNPQTKITYALKTAGHVRLTVHDARGVLVATLVDERQGAGERSVAWDGRTATGRRAASGVYFARLATEAGKETRKMTLIK